MQSGEVMQGGEVALEPNVCSCQHSQQQAARVSQAYQHYVACHYWLGQLYQRFMAGQALLPPAMGLGVQQFSRLSEAFGGPMPVASEVLRRQLLVSELLQSRYQERDDLATWLSGYLAAPSPELSLILATASMGFKHLWEDLGLDSRAQLRNLMLDCFPQLVALNQHDMRWKKFFYRQLCEQAGSYVCRAPSCDVCPERALCFTTDEPA